jgi:hypothetical protein
VTTRIRVRHIYVLGDPMADWRHIFPRSLPLDACLGIMHSQTNTSETLQLFLSGVDDLIVAAGKDRRDLKELGEKKRAVQD